MNKWIKRILTILALAAAGYIAYIALCFFGNPVSKLLAKNATEKYVAEKYPDCYITKVGYNFKNGDYYANVQKEGSTDINFFVYTDWFGNIGYDAYDSYVTEKQNTKSRMMMEYRALLDEALPQDSVDFTLDIFFGDIVYEGIYEKYAYETYSEKIVGMPDEDVIIDGEYDYHDLGYKYGHVVLYACHEDVSIEKACEILLTVKEKLNDKNLGFYSIDFVLTKPRQKDGMPSEDETRINIDYFLWDDIYEDGLGERVQSAHDRLTEYYRQEDAKKQEFIQKVDEEFRRNNK